MSRIEERLASIEAKMDFVVTSIKKFNGKISMVDVHHQEILDLKRDIDRIKLDIKDMWKKVIVAIAIVSTIVPSVISYVL